MGVWECGGMGGSVFFSHTPTRPYSHTLEKDIYFSGMALVFWCYGVWVLLSRAYDNLHSVEFNRRARKEGAECAEKGRSRCPLRLLRALCGSLDRSLCVSGYLCKLSCILLIQSTKTHKHINSQTLSSIIRIGRRRRLLGVEVRVEILFDIDIRPHPSILQRYQRPPARLIDHVIDAMIEPPDLG